MKQISEIMDPRLLQVVSVAGFALMLAGFAGYVVNPSVVFQSAFIVGVVLLAVGYAMIYLAGRRTGMECAAEEEEEDERGFFYILDEDYSAPVGDATIEDLSKRE